MAFLSVIIPTYHRNDLLALCLERLAPGRQEGGMLKAESGKLKLETGKLKAEIQNEDQGTPNSKPQTPNPTFTYEVIVTDDGAATTAEELVRTRFPWVRWTAGPRRGPAANRNHGARRAAGDWVAFIDDDCLADPAWLHHVAAAAGGATWDVIEGRTIIPDRRDSPFLHGVENTTGGCYWSCNLSVRREIFLRMGGFDEDFLIAGGEDMEFAWKIRSRKMRAHFCPPALVLHPQRPYALKAFLRSIWDRKWILLYRQKTGGAPPASAGRVRIGMAVVRDHFFALARNLAYGWRDLHRDNWKAGLFGMFWPWMVLPLQLPHLIWWEFCFRRQRGTAVPLVK